MKNTGSPRILSYFEDALRALPNEGGWTIGSLELHGEWIIFTCPATPLRQIPSPHSSYVEHGPSSISQEAREP